MENRTRRKFSPEYRDEAVRLLTSTGRRVSQVASDLGISAQVLGRWVKLARPDAEEAGLNQSERAELERLRKENEELRLDRAFLKKASIFFARETQATNSKHSN